MILAMEKSNKTNIINFPFQVKEWKDLEGVETVKQARFFAAKVLNKANLGLCELPDEIKEKIHSLNKILPDFNLEPLEGDF